ncbi:hypothetical protein B0H10DRAFT_2229750 [Mycena sp. CBHHK59/15]|nr:hypothetical protein B0H10DRAFT_2229750 [Mycena sp. CBHHK59/15]
MQCSPSTFQPIFSTSRGRELKFPIVPARRRGANYPPSPRVRRRSALLPTSSNCYFAVLRTISDPVCTRWRCAPPPPISLHCFDVLQTTVQALILRARWRHAALSVHILTGYLDVPRTISNPVRLKLPLITTPHVTYHPRSWAVHSATPPFLFVFSTSRGPPLKLSIIPARQRRTAPPTFLFVFSTSHGPLLKLSIIPPRRWRTALPIHISTGYLDVPRTISDSAGPKFLFVFWTSRGPRLKLPTIPARWRAANHSVPAPLPTLSRPPHHFFSFIFGRPADHGSSSP